MADAITSKKGKVTRSLQPKRWTENVIFWKLCNCRLNYDDKLMFILCPFGYVFALVNSSGRLLVFVYISSSFRGFSLYSIIPNVGDY